MKNEGEARNGAIVGSMSDSRLPIAIKKLPGGYRLQFSDGKSSLMVYGTGSDTAHATGSLTTEEARELAEEVARVLTDAWSKVPA